MSGSQPLLGLYGRFSIVKWTSSNSLLDGDILFSGVFGQSVDARYRLCRCLCAYQSGVFGQTVDARYRLCRCQCRHQLGVFGQSAEASYRHLSGVQTHQFGVSGQSFDARYRPYTPM